MQWQYVEPDEVLRAWQEIGPGIRRGLDRGCGDSLDEEMVVGRLLGGSFQLWVRVEEDGKISGSIILYVVQREKGKAIEVIMTSGKWWNDGLAMAALKDYAAQIGAYTIEAIIRNGLVSRLKSEGWRQKAVVMDVEI